MFNIFLLIFFIQVAFFAFASWFKTDKVTDLSYGLTFVIVALWLWYLGTPLALVIMPILWGLRLAGYLFMRILRTKTDKRFDGIRESFWAFAKFWLLQAVAIFVISLSMIAADPAVLSSSYLIWGWLIFALGLIIESVSDQQKFNFKNQPANKGRFITTGLWRYSRHPNYFGEMLVWWGVYLFVLPSLSGWGHLAILSPLFITTLLLFVSGIPTLEKKYPERYGQAWLDYKRRTSLLIPCWPRNP
jgi:steroid 5-alpha reductase family enzyme